MLFSQLYQRVFFSLLLQYLCCMYKKRTRPTSGKFHWQKLLLQNVLDRTGLCFLKILLGPFYIFFSFISCWRKLLKVALSLSPSIAVVIQLRNAFIIAKQIVNCKHTLVFWYRGLYFLISQHEVFADFSAAYAERSRSSEITKQSVCLFEYSIRLKATFG